MEDINIFSLLGNGKGATAGTNDAQGKAGNPIVADRNLIRQVRRRLKKEGQALRKVEGGYAVVDLRPWHVYDVKELARKLRICLCDLCGDRPARTLVERMLVCTECEAELKRKVA